MSNRSLLAAWQQRWNRDLPVDHSTPGFKLEATLPQQCLDHALATVSPTMRAVLLLRLRDARSCKEIARDLDLTVAQVKRYLALGYERLGKALEN